MIYCNDIHSPFHCNVCSPCKDTYPAHTIRVKSVSIFMTFTWTSYRPACDHLCINVHSKLIHGLRVIHWTCHMTCSCWCVIKSLFRRQPLDTRHTVSCVTRHTVPCVTQLTHGVICHTTDAQCVMCHTTDAQFVCMYRGLIPSSWAS